MQNLLDKRKEETAMKNRCMQRILSCLLLISLLIGILPAMADVPALRAY